MPSLKQDTVPVSCPRCGFTQLEPRTAYSTVCRKCGQHFRVQEALHPAPKAKAKAIEQRQVRCFQCGTELEAPLEAASTMCKRCSGYVDLSDYRIAATVSKNFRTHGSLVVEEKGYLLNTEAQVGEAVIKGRFIGKLAAERSLEIYNTASIKGSFMAGCLVIPPGNHFRWPSPLRMGGAEIGGELVANLCSSGTVVLKSTARFFGNIESVNLVMEAGAVFVGSAKIGNMPQEAVASPAIMPAPVPLDSPAPARPATRARVTRARRTVRNRSDGLAAG